MIKALQPVPKGCGKIAYTTRKDAEKAMRHTVARRGAGGPVYDASAYHCRHCGLFHFGHKKRGRTLDIRDLRRQQQEMNG
jgi:hypothetical protein